MHESKRAQLTQRFSQKGFNPVIGNIFHQQQKWLSWYRGEVNDFHFYQVRTINGKTIGKERNSLQMPKKICEDWAGLLFNEETELVVSDTKAQEILDRALKRNNFTQEMSNFVEQTFALGTGVMLPYVNNGEVELDFLFGSDIIPLSHRNHEIEDIAVVQEFSMQKEHYTHVAYHIFDKGKYYIVHELYKAKQQTYLGQPTSLKALFSEEELEMMYHEDGYYFEYETAQPLFQVFKPAITNNFDIHSPMGVSVFANAISTFKGLDTTYNALVRDTELSRKRLMVNSEATRTQQVKEQTAKGARIRNIKYFDEDDDLFMSTPMGEEGEPFKEWSPTLNLQPYIESINSHMNWVSAKTGLGTGYYSFDMDSGMTATEVISRNSDTWKNRQKHIKRLEEVLKGLMYSVLKLEQSTGGYQGVPEDLEYTVYFDDSIMQDDQKRLDDMKEDAQNGFIPKSKYIAEKYKIDEEEAKRWLQETRQQEQEDQQAFLGTFDVDEEGE